MEVNDEQYANTLVPKFFKLSGKVMVERDVHDLNASEPILLKLFGKATEEREEQPEKA